MKQQDSIIISARDYYGPLHNINNFWEREDGYEIYHTWPEHLSTVNKGFIYLLKCRPGLILSISKQYPTASFSLYFKEKEDSTCIHFSFFLGNGYHVLRRHNQAQDINFDSNQGYVIYKLNSRGGRLNYPTEPFCTIGVLVEPWFISRFWEGATGEFALNLQDVLADKAAGGYFKTSLPMLPGINVCLNEILGCPYTDARRQLFLESKALELLTLSFDQLNPQKGKGFSGFEMTPGSRNFIHEARDIMIADIKNPPSLTELSRMVGVNRTTLGQHFRKVYGVTIFDYLRIYRLEESRRLLRAGKRSVTEVALEVGYSQQATFTREFKKYFGRNPSDYFS
ncbi:AraC family transcriptional regulator [uncultured Desulfobacter sp.]|uniref:helix-turn-helix transcriptional regulator n=1 Tax=uncultured Desulfobacter sp. TaxID=240139 RepID=UPI0029F4A5F4|nr:AraC family transcriptional regulator [uncultured Desulfobacter sp.]